MHVHDGLFCQYATELMLFVLLIPIISYLYSSRKKGVVYRERPVMPTDVPFQDEDVHNEIKLNLPIVSGRLKLALFKWFSSSALGKMILERQKSKNGLSIFRELLIPEDPTFVPIVAAEFDPHTEDIDYESIMNVSSADGEFHFKSMSNLCAAYKSGTLTPLVVAKRILLHIKTADSGEKPLKSFIEVYEDLVLEQAHASTLRWQNGKALSVFDGIFVGVKDQYKLSGHHMRCGTPTEGDSILTADDEGELVQILRRGGAIMLGVTNMHQFGMGVTGINPSPLHGTNRNPYNLDTSTGGSSGGSASAVAAGLCSFSLGSDGGGSIRIPAGICGVVGLKGTFGRFSKDGTAFSGSSVAYSGPICSNMRDMVMAYGLLSSRASSIPPVVIGDWQNTDLSGLRIGVDQNLMMDLPSDISAGCDKAIGILAGLGASIVQVNIPEMFLIKRAHLIVIMSEMFTAHAECLERCVDQLNTDLVVGMSIAGTFSAQDYIQACKQRTRAMSAMKYLFNHEMDLLISPAIGQFQPEITKTIEQYGLADTNHSIETMRFSGLGNLTGIPGLSLPVSYTKDGNLPVPVLLQASWWREDILLKVGHALESQIKHKQPELYFDIIEK